MQTTDSSPIWGAPWRPSASDLGRADLVELCAGLRLSKEDRAELMAQGIQTDEVAKHIASAGDKNTDAALAAAFLKHRIPLEGDGACEAFRTHGAFLTGGICRRSDSSSLLHQQRMSSYLPARPNWGRTG